MTDEQLPDQPDQPEESEPKTSTRPPPRNPFAVDEAQDDGVPALIDNRRTAAIYGVVVGLIMLVLVVGLCVAVSYAFSP